MIPLRRKPPVTQVPSLYLHLFKNIGFLFASWVLFPLSATLTAMALVYSWKYPARKTPEPSRRLTIMVSGVRATKGLTLAREFARAGHRVIAVEEDAYRFNSARFSNCISEFYTLPDPLASQKLYTARLVFIAKTERVNAYVPACGVATTLCDGYAKPALEAIGCHVLQFDGTLGARLDKKDAFMQMCVEADLRVPYTELVRSMDQVLAFDFAAMEGRKFLMKCIGVDDRTRNDMTLFPMNSRREMERRLNELNISDENPYILQEFIQGVEYLSESLVYHSRVLTYSCCESSDLLVNYTSLPPIRDSVSAKCLAFVEHFAAVHDITGQIAFDFILSKVDGELYPIECNPRTHTAIVLHAGDPKWARAYVAAATGEVREMPDAAVLPPRDALPVYWIGHEIFDALRYMDPLTLIERIVFERDGHWDMYDPFPFLALYHLQWPMVFISSLLSGRKWTRINASTGKVFWC